MARRKSETAEAPEQMELIPECSEPTKRKLRKLLANMESADADKKAAKAEYDVAEDAVIEFIRDVEKVMPDADGNYRLRLDADETILVGRGKAKVTVKRVKNAETVEVEGDDDDTGDGQE